MDKRKLRPRPDTDSCEFSSETWTLIRLKAGRYAVAAYPAYLYVKWVISERLGHPTPDRTADARATSLLRHDDHAETATSLNGQRATYSHSAYIHVRRRGAGQELRRSLKGLRGRSHPREH